MDDTNTMISCALYMLLDASMVHFDGPGMVKEVIEVRVPGEKSCVVVQGTRLSINIQTIEL